MNRITKLSKAFLLAFFGIGLASCSSKVATSTPQESSSIPTTTTTQTTIVYNDTDVESGKYMYLDTVYEFNKTNKSLKATKYSSYSQYKTNEGVSVFDKAVQYVDYLDLHAVYVNHNNIDYYIYNDNNKTKIAVINGSSTRASVLAKLTETIAEPEYGTYVSDKKTQDKLGPDGHRISDGELTATKATLYAGSNSTTHSDTALCSIDNYVAKFLQGQVIIYIPHNPGETNCELIFEESNVINFTNYSEALDGDQRYADYSCSGTMTKIE